MIYDEHNRGSHVIWTVTPAGLLFQTDFHIVENHKCSFYSQHKVYLIKLPLLDQFKVHCCAIKPVFTIQLRSDQQSRNLPHRFHSNWHFFHLKNRNVIHACDNIWIPMSYCTFLISFLLLSLTLMRRTLQVSGLITDQTNALNSIHQSPTPKMRNRLVEEPKCASLLY